MTRFHIAHTWYELPDGWSEVPASQVLPILLTVYSVGKTPTGRLKILSLVNPVPAKTFRKLNPFQVNELCRLLDWVFETPLQEKPFEKFTHLETTYYLPAKELRSITFNEFVTAVTYLYQFYYVPDERADNLTRLIATLCRPAEPGLTSLSKHFRGDLREPFNEHVVEARALAFHSLEAGIAAGVLQYFVSQFRWLYETYKIFNSQQLDGSGESSQEKLEFEWVDQLMVLRDFAFQVGESKLLGTVQQIEESPVCLVFETLEHMKEMQETTPVTPTPETNE